MALTRLHIRSTTTRLLLLRALKLMSQPEVELWLVEARSLADQLTLSGQPGARYIVESIDEFVENIDFIRREDA